MSSLKKENFQKLDNWSSKRVLHQNDADQPVKCGKVFNKKTIEWQIGEKWASSRVKQR